MLQYMYDVRVLCMENLRKVGHKSPVSYHHLVVIIWILPQSMYDTNELHSRFSSEIPSRFNAPEI